MAYYDQATLKDTHGRPIPQYFNPAKNLYEPAQGSDGATDTNVKFSSAMLPVDMQGRRQDMIVTHTGSIVAPTTGNSASSIISLDGFDKLFLHLKTDSSHNCSAGIKWSLDGTTLLTEESVFTSGARSNGVSAAIEVKAPYAQFVLYNTDAAPHTMQSWLVLKV